jgi:hypothetical protein
MPLEDFPATHHEVRDLERRVELLERRVFQLEDIVRKLQESDPSGPPGYL